MLKKIGTGESLPVTPEHLSVREKIKQEAEERVRQKNRERGKQRHSAKLTVKSIEFALRTHGGNISDAADYLGVYPAYLRKKVEASPKLSSLIEEMTSQLLDFAENVVAQNVFAGNLAASMWLLKTKGKDRGYSEKVTNELELGEKSIRSADELIKAMREGKKELTEMGLLDGGEVKWLEPKQLQENQDQES